MGKAGTDKLIEESRRYRAIKLPRIHHDPRQRRMSRQSNPKVPSII
jgi:hypothetical protein